MSNIKDLTGFKIGMLQVLERKREKNRTYYYCRCDCGTKKWIRADRIKNSSSQSCGCFKKEYQFRQGKNIGDKFIKKFIVKDTNLQVIGTDKVNSRNTSGYKGVQWDPRRNRWLAIITFQKKVHYLGRYYKKEEAIKVRKEAEEKLHQNFIKWYEEFKNENN